MRLALPREPHLHVKRFQRGEERNGYGQYNQHMNLAKYRFLLVDDQRAFQITMKTVLVALGVKSILFVDHGDAAVRACRSAHFDFVLIDYNLGSGKNGRQVLEELKERRILPAHTSCIIITGDNTRSMVMGAIETQPDDYLMKPFSQQQLAMRLQRAFVKRQSLLSVFRPLNKGRYPEAINALEHILRRPSRYTNYCRNLLAELFCKVGRYQEAEAMLRNVIAERPLYWAKVAMARVMVGTERANQSIPLLDEVIRHYPLWIDAYDIKAQAQRQLGDDQSALETLQRACELSPYSLNRQQHVADLAHKLDSFDLAHETYKQIYELSCRSVYQDSVHLCNYIRSTMENALHQETTQMAARFESEAITALFRARQTRLFTDFDYDTYEKLIQACHQARRNELLKAKKNYYRAIQHYPNIADIPTDFLPEGLDTLVRIGELEEAQRYMARIENEKMANPFLSNTLDFIEQQGGLESRLHHFRELNQDGIALYDQYSYKEAAHYFEKALELAPTNSGAALNLIQALLKLAGQTKKPDSHLLERIKHLFRNVDGIALPNQHKKRRQELTTQFNQVRAGH